MALPGASGDGAYDDALGQWSLAALAAGGTASIDITATVLGAGIYLNEAEVYERVAAYEHPEDLQELATLMRFVDGAWRVVRTDPALRDQVISGAIKVDVVFDAQDVRALMTSVEAAE